MESETLDLVAASLRADTHDMASYLEVLTTKLTESFPRHIQIERRGLLSRSKGIRRIVVLLGDDRFTIENDSATPRFLHSSLVRGIALRNDQLELSAWIEELSRAVVRQAESSEQDRLALEQLLL